MSAITLRDYQMRGIEEIRDAMRRYRRVLYVLPTGGGKTMMFSKIAQGVQAKEKRVLTMAHRRELLRQISKTMDVWRVPHAVLNADSRGAPRADGVVASVFTLVNRMQHMKQFQLLIVDEAHHAAIGTTWNRVLNQFPEAKILGVTATPIRLDGKGLADSFDTIVLGPSVAELTAMGYLTPAEVYAPKDAIDLRGLRISGGDYAKNELAAAMDKPSITGNAVEHYLRLANGKQAVAFCCSIEHARDVAAAFNDAGIKAESIDGNMEDHERDGVLMRFGRHQTKVLTSCDLISEGFDMPSIEVAILLRPTKSLGLYMQQVGRAIRPSPGKDRTVVLDHAGNTIQHGFVDDVRQWSLNAKERKSKGDKAPALRICPTCRAIHHPAPLCPRCGHEYEVASRFVKHVNGDLEQITRIEDVAEAMIEQDIKKRYDILINVGKHRNIENPQAWAWAMVAGEYAARLAKEGRRPEGYMLNGLTMEERDKLAAIVRGTQNQVEMVL